MANKQEYAYDDIKETHNNALYSVDSSLIKFARNYKPSKLLLEECERIRNTPINVSEMEKQNGCVNPG